MKIELNNEHISLPDNNMNVSDLIAWRGIQNAGVAVAINNKIISRKLWSDTLLHEGDQVVLIAAAYGG